MTPGHGKSDVGSEKMEVSTYDEAMKALSSLITKRSRAEKSNHGDRFDLMFDYLRILELEEPLKHMKIIHVAGTKGKGSTCTFTESILRNCGFRTGLFTSPHLIDVRERFKLDGFDIDKGKFLDYFWWCWDKLKENSTEKVPMPTYFRFLSLLAIKIFLAEKVDVAILEVGLGGKYDATNVIEHPVVCGIASLGYDHMEILGNTLGEISGEKAGIFKLETDDMAVKVTGVTDVVCLVSNKHCHHEMPAFTVQQPEEAMRVLIEKASNLNVCLKVVPPLNHNLVRGIQLGLDGEHQYVNAGLAVALCFTWLQRTGHLTISYPNDTTTLPDQFIKGLSTATMQGRGQIVPDHVIQCERPGDNLVFYLDGAHSPESMDVCSNWFSSAIKADFEQPAKGLHQHVQSAQREIYKQNFTPILLFNCMSVRDPQLLLPRLMTECSSRGVRFKKALFVPNASVYYEVGGTHARHPVDTQVDLTWQFTLQRIWENLMHGEKGRNLKSGEENELKLEKGKSVEAMENSCVFHSLPMAVNWLRESVRKNQSAKFQVLVTGSLHLVGDILKLIKK